MHIHTHIIFDRHLLTHDSHLFSFLCLHMCTETNKHAHLYTTLKFLNRLRSGALQPDSEANSRESKGEVGCSANGSGPS